MSIGLYVHALSFRCRLGFSESVEHIEQMGTYCTMRQAVSTWGGLAGPAVLKLQAGSEVVTVPWGVLATQPVTKY